MKSAIQSNPNDPKWQRAIRHFSAEAGKDGLRMGDKSFPEMSKRELHEERKTLVHAVTNINRRIDKAEGDGNKEEVQRLRDAMDAGLEIIERIDAQLHVQHLVDERFSSDSPAPNSGWVGSDGRPVRVLTNKQRLADLPQFQPPQNALGDEGAIGFGAYIRGMVGVGEIPASVRNTLSEGTDSAGGFTVPTYLSGRLIDRLRAKAVLMRAGAVTVPLDTQKTSIARLATDPTASWRAENASVGGTDPTFEKITFTAQSLACLVKVSRELIEDSVNLEDALYNAFANAMALELDRVGMFGSGTPPEPQGFFNANINAVSMGTNGAQLTGYAKVIDALYELQLDNAGDPSGILMHPRTWATIQKFADSTGQPLIPPPAIQAIPQFTTTAIPITQVQGTSGSVCSSILSGDFSQLMFGIRQGLRIELLKERFADNLQYGFLVHLRGDVQLAHPESFVKLIGILP